MTIGENVMDYIREYVEEMLDEENYDYFIDAVTLAIDISVLYVVLYTNATKKAVNCLAKNGLVFSNNIDNCQTMAYRDMLYVTITTSKERYETMKEENHKMETISLNKIVEWAKSRGYKKTEIVALLHKTISCATQ